MFAAQDAYTQQDCAVWNGIPLEIAARGLRGGLVGPLIAKSVEAYSPEIIHLHGLWGPGEPGIRREIDCASRLIAPLVISPHGMLEPWALARGRWKKKVAWQAWHRALFERATVLRALCDEEARSLARVAPNIPICVIPNGIDVPELPASQKCGSICAVPAVSGAHSPQKGSGTADRSMGASSGRSGIWLGGS